MNKDVIKVFIGYDPVESVAWHALAASIYEKSSKPVALIPLNLRNLTECYGRNRDSKQSNEFSFSRFLVPHLCGFDGMAVFMDCDMLLRTDIAEVLAEVNEKPGKAVYVVKHDYTPQNDVKYLNTKQYAYPRKNWSSFVVWDCAHPSNREVTSDFVNSASPMELHRFLWLDDEEIGELDVRWNWLVGEYSNPPSDVKNVHWTVGGPYFNEYASVDFNEEWFAQKERMTYVKQRDDL